jgi:hypothetical protein
MWFVELWSREQGIDVGDDGQTMTGGLRADFAEEIPPVELWMFRCEFAGIVRLTTAIPDSKADYGVDAPLREE